MSIVSYLGSKISLISKSEIRYEGILYTLDVKESTVALAKVKSFGTEGRPTDIPVAPRDEVYEYIIFRVSDIKHLHVCEGPKHHGLPHDPAIIQHSQPMSSHFPLSLGLAPFQHFPSQTTYSQMPSTLTSNHYSGSTRSAAPPPRKSPTSDACVQVSGNVDFDIRPRESREPLKPPNRELSKQPNYQNRRRMSDNRPPSGRRNTRRARSRSSGPPAVEKFENEYDFEQANAEFQELENKLAKNKIEEGDAESSPNTEDATGAYDKEKSFFDDISCEATQRSKGFPRFDWRYERKLNVETFGASANNAWLRRRRGRGGYRRGFRGGRGGFNRTNEPPVQKTVTFVDTPTIKEVEVVNVEVEPDPIPVIEVIAEKEKKDWPEPTAATTETWE